MLLARRDSKTSNSGRNKGVGNDWIMMAQREEYVDASHWVCVDRARKGRNREEMLILKLTRLLLTTKKNIPWFHLLRSDEFFCPLCQIL